MEEKLPWARWNRGYSITPCYKWFGSIKTNKQTKKFQLNSKCNQTSYYFYCLEMRKCISILCTLPSMCTYRCLWGKGIIGSAYILGLFSWCSKCLRYTVSEVSISLCLTVPPFSLTRWGKCTDINCSLFCELSMPWNKIKYDVIHLS